MQWKLKIRTYDGQTFNRVKKKRRKPTVYKVLVRIVIGFGLVVCKGRPAKETLGPVNRCTITTGGV